jgi:hypothetical protein
VAEDSQNVEGATQHFNGIRIAFMAGLIVDCFSASSSHNVCPKRQVGNLVQHSITWNNLFDNKVPVRGVS